MELRGQLRHDVRSQVLPVRAASCSSTSHVPTSSPLYNSCVTPRVFYVCSARRSGLCSACCGQSHLHRRPRAPARGRSHRATSCFRLENGVGEHRAPLIMRGTAVRPLTSTCAGGPEADETSSMSMSVSMSMSMLGTRPQRVGVFLLRWPQHHAARSTCAAAPNVRSSPLAAPTCTWSWCASPGTAFPTRSYLQRAPTHCMQAEECRIPQPGGSVIIKVASVDAYE